MQQLNSLISQREKQQGLSKEYKQGIKDKLIMSLEFICSRLYTAPPSVTATLLNLVGKVIVLPERVTW